jgi:hypothetical protein
MRNPMCSFPLKLSSRSRKDGRGIPHRRLWHTTHVAFSPSVCVRSLGRLRDLGMTRICVFEVAKGILDD